MTANIIPLNNRFYGYLPVVVDVETGGVESRTDALLEIAAVFVEQQPETGELVPALEHFHKHVVPFEGSRIQEEALKVNGIEPYHPFRFAEDEKKVIEDLFAMVKKAVKKHKCRRAVLVGHNAHFDLGFVQAAAKRCGLLNKCPFHRFTVLDTATLAGLAYRKTVLAKALKQAGIAFDKNAAHGALYDTQKTAELFCRIVNNFDAPGAPPASET